MANLSGKQTQRLSMIRQSAPADLVVSMESMADRLSNLVDLRENPGAIYSKEIAPLAIDIAMEGIEPSLSSFDDDKYEPDAGIWMESLTENDSEPPTFYTMRQAHEHNLKQLMENSVMEARIANPNQRNLNELTPFECFMPFTIIRSYLPLVAMNLVPYVVPAKDFIRLKWHNKYIVTKDGQRYLRPDIYSEPDKAQEILDSARGRRVTSEWYPLGTEVATEDAADYVGEDGKYYTLPTERMILNGFDVLGESGGIRQNGDALDIDICVFGARAKVTTSDGEKVVEATEIMAYPDLTSISPQRSVSFDVRYPLINDAGEIEGVVEDRVYGDYDGSREVFNLVSLNGVTKQIQFGGHLSNKNNVEYLSFTDDWDVKQYPIVNGYRANVPITLEDLQLYNQTSSIDIVANAINEITEIFTELEDNAVIKTLRDTYVRNLPKGVHHGYRHFEKGPVAFDKEIDVTYGVDRLLKKNEYIQDLIGYQLARYIGDIRTTCQNEPFKVVLYAHPNIASLFVGDNIDWKITPGTTVSEGIRTDYNMGVYTADGNAMRLVSSMKFKEEDGVCWIAHPVNEQNWQSIKHFKYSLHFDRDHRNNEMKNVPNVLGVARFDTHCYTPIQGRLRITGYK